MDMDAELVKLMKAVNVSSVSDISQGALQLQRLNKGPLQSSLMSMVSLYEKNVNLCKAAAAKVDRMKTEQIELQKQMMKSQNDQINSVQKTVRTEIE
jgi:uncharacterized protein YaiL (DUF2058 family)